MSRKADNNHFAVESHNQKHVAELLTGMLEPDPEKRITAQKAQAILAKITSEAPKDISGKASTFLRGVADAFKNRLGF